jgi:adenosylcobinamide kinase/adenosylcobinamide-phosphate guanylyltransferase
MITGGARSGKSSFAEKMAADSGENILYIATAKPIDEEMKNRIRKHRESRPSHWETLEAFKQFDVVLKDKLTGRSAVLLDCITIMVTNLMLEYDEGEGLHDTDWDTLTQEQVDRIEQSIKQEIEKLIRVAKDSTIPFIFVTNEVGLGVVPPYAMGRDYRDIAGRVNQQLAQAADEVYFCVSGIPMKVK